MNKSKQKTLTILLVVAFAIAAIPLASPAQAASLANDTFSIMQISDTQFLAATYPSLFNNLTSWIVSNSAAYNLKMVVHTGDIVDNINGTTGTYSDPVQWDRANTAMSQLLNAGIPYTWDAGNHDQIPWNDANGTWLGSNYSAFNASNMRSKPYWVSDFFDSKNTAVRFTFNGYDFLIINIEYMATNSTLNWMKNLLDTYQGANVIVAAHTYLNKAAGYGFASAGLPGEVAWCTNLKTILDGYPKVFLTLSGHDPTGTANMTRVGNRQEIFFDRQGANNSTGAAAVRIYTFNLTSMKVNTATWAYNLTSNTWNWLTDAYNQFSFNTLINNNDWTLTNNARSLKAYPNLQEYVWQKNASLAPNGPYDKIGLHRLIKTNITPKGVVLLLPGTYGSGEFLTSNPTTDNYTMTENESQALYWANRDYDVYAMDYRTHFVPDNLNPLPPANISSTQLSFLANWGWDQWISDINEAVNKVKDISGAAKIFMGGQSFGGRATMNYATMFPQDVKGIILMDGGNASRNTTPTNTYNLTSALKQENTTQSWYLISPVLPGSTPVSPTFKYLAQYALANPSAPAFNPYTNTTFGPSVNPLTNKPFANITEVFGFIMQSSAMTNTTAGYMKPTTLVRTFANMDMFWPDRLNLEYNAYMNWNNCPYVTRDFDDNFQYVTVPLIGFTSQLYGIPRSGPVGKIATADVTKVVLPGYGHLDVFEGINSARDVSEPILQWMLDRSFTPTIDQASFFNSAKTANSATGNGQTSFALGTNVKFGFNLQSTDIDGRVVFRITVKQPDQLPYIVSSTAMVSTSPTSAFATFQLIPNAPAGTWTAQIQIFAADGVTPLAAKTMTFTVN